jgi:hypothetical protein
MALPFLPVDIRARTFKQRTTFEGMTNAEVRKHCALPLENVLELLDMIGPSLEMKTGRSQATTPETQLIASLSFFRSGSFQYVDGTVTGLSQSTVSRVLERFSTKVCSTLAPGSRQHWL